jgi:hypothetical protein
MALCTIKSSTYICWAEYACNSIASGTPTHDHARSQSLSMEASNCCTLLLFQGQLLLKHLPSNNLTFPVACLTYQLEAKHKHKPSSIIPAVLPQHRIPRCHWHSCSPCPCVIRQPPAGLQGWSGLAHQHQHQRQGFTAPWQISGDHMPSLLQPQCMLVSHSVSPLELSGRMPLGQQKFSMH